MLPTLGEIFPAVQDFTVLEGLIACIVTGFVGYSFKWRIILRYRKRILKLENEMLANHSRILTLEKEKAMLERELKKHFNKTQTA